MVPLEWTEISDAVVQKVRYVPHPRADQGLCGELHVEFRSGAVYRFTKVPEVFSERLAHSHDPGKYYYDQIRGQFTAEKMT